MLFAVADMLSTFGLYFGEESVAARQDRQLMKVEI